jgi:DNA-directed RNA polymerase specialized sigma24 family protein
MPTATETVIAAALRSGDLRRAVELLLDSYQEELFAYCDRLVGSERAASVYGRVLALALDDMQRVAGAASLRAWLFRLARGIVLQVHRTSPRLFPLALSEGYAPVAGPTVEAADERSAPAGGQQELGRLDPRALEVLQLSLWHGLLLFEVAEVVERSESEVRRLAAQGLGRLALQSDRPGLPS